MLRRNPLWPYLLVLVALFALIVNAPRRWERFARSESLSATLARNANQSAGPQTIYHYIAPEQRELRPVVAEYDLDDPKDRSASDSTSLSSREGATAIDADAPQASAIEPRPLLRLATCLRRRPRLMSHSVSRRFLFPPRY